MAKDFLLEIGTEEIPAKFMPGALKQLEALAGQNLKEYRLNYEELKVMGTPRRLALLIKGLAERQEERTLEVKGPAKKAAYDSEGNPTKALLGFAKGQGVDIEKLTIKELNGVEYIHAVKEEKGNETQTILPEICRKLIFGLSFPKPMRWAYYDQRFARPIRWLVALLGDQVVSVELEGVTSCRVTRGHRFLGVDSFALSDAGEYEKELLHKGFVLVDDKQREEKIWEQIQKVATDLNGTVDPDEELLSEINFLVEYPTALYGSFEEDLLALPEEVIITPMKEHQRYFPVRGQDGKLLNKFITVRNGDDYALDNVRLGNERVLRARLSDAKFFYDEDLKKPLADRVEALKKIVFQESLGTIYDKVERIGQLVSYLAPIVQLNEEELKVAQRAAFLAKADLVTGMVYEFPELQGVMGQEYALKNGEDAKVAQAIFEHYQPRFAGDELPESMVGTLVSIADKIDTIVGCFAIGIQPSGSQDPYALRRQALGICHMILQKGLTLSLEDLVKESYSYLYKAQLKLSQEETLKEVLDFFKARLRNILLDEGYNYELVDAVLAGGFYQPKDLALRAKALVTANTTEGFAQLLQAYTRVNNLAKKTELDKVDRNLFATDEEKELFRVFEEVQSKGVDIWEKAQYDSWLSLVQELTPVINSFFEKVMVMDPNEDIRNNRLALLRVIRDYLAKIGDLALL